MTDKPMTMEERYRLLNRLINAALLAFHPDHNRDDDREFVASMTRGLIAAKKNFREVYRHLKDEQP